MGRMNDALRKAAEERCAGMVRRDRKPTQAHRRVIHIRR